MAIIRLPCIGICLSYEREEGRTPFSLSTRLRKPETKGLHFILISEISHIYNERREVLTHYTCLVDREEVMENGS